MDRRTSLSLLALGLAAAGGRTAGALQPTGGVKLTVLYGPPPNPAEFERYYLDVHMPLVRQIAGARRIEAARCLPQADGSAPAFHRIFEMWFDSAEHMAAVMGTPEGARVRADLANFTTGTTVTRLVSRVD